MQVLEKILEEIDDRVHFYDNADEPMMYVETVKDIISKHMSGNDINAHTNDGWIPVEDEKLWDILFEEACVEGEQARRIYNRLKETFGGERSEMDGKL